MAVVGAGAHRLDLRRRRIVAAEREGEHLFDEAGARTARRRCLGMRAHVVDREQLLLGDRLDDGALADAVAAANLGVVAHRGNRILAAVTAVAEIGGAEHQPLAHLGNIGAVAQMLEIPGAVDGVAIEHGADDLLVAQDDPLVDAAVGVLQHDFLLVRARGEIAGGEQVDAGHLQLGRDDGSLVAGKALQRELIGANPGLVEQRRDEAVGLAAVLARIRRPHRCGRHRSAWCRRRRCRARNGCRPSWPVRNSAGCRPPSRPDRPEARSRRQSARR